MSKDELKELEAAAKPLMDYLSQSGKFNPHHKIIVTSHSAELLSGEMTVRIKE